MKKSFKSVLLVLVLVLALSYVGANYAWPYLSSIFNHRTYSQTNCLTDNITESMDIYSIAKSYRDGYATVAVEVSGKCTANNKYYTSLGSGVCVASKGYKTSLESNYVASAGSYIVTNYHVIDFLDSNEFSDCQIVIMPEDENTYACDLLWFNKDLDLALLYCDSINLNYVRMKDRIINCNDSEKLDYEQIFAIGTPLDTAYLNRLTVGNIGSNNNMTMVTIDVIYPYTSNGKLTYSLYTSSSSGVQVLSNVYEDVVDITVGITSGNSGGGCFDSNGYLIGLTTLGGNVNNTGGNQMNGIVAIYPIIEVLDKIIENKEAGGNNNIYTIESLSIKGVDAIEAGYVSYLKEHTGYSYYFIDGNFYSSSYSSAFSFDENGYYLIENSAGKLKSIGNDVYITACQINNGEKITIEDRNDLIYALLQIDNGDDVKFYYKGNSLLGLERSVSIAF